VNCGICGTIRVPRLPRCPCGNTVTVQFAERHGEGENPATEELCGSVGRMSCSMMRYWTMSTLSKRWPAAVPCGESSERPA
jgi:hypothetical protein